MGGLSHYLEGAGLPTAHISLIREHTEQIRPPRALWVPFELGRPLGAPGDAAFQRRVLRRVLSLFEAENGPVLEDFEEEAPAGAAFELLACPVSFDTEELDATERRRRALAAEIEALEPEYRRAVEARGRTTVGPSGLSVPEAAEFTAAFLGENPPDNPRTDVSLAYALRLAVEDLKAFYIEAAAARAGQGAVDGSALADWFWQKTAAGEVLQALRVKLGQSLDKELQIVGGFLLVPMSQAGRTTNG